MHVRIAAGHGNLIFMQLKCRHDNNDVLAQACNFWPYGGPWGTTDEFCSNSPELLRLHRIAPLPSALPNLQAPLTPHLQLGFTAAQALRRVAVRAPICDHLSDCHKWQSAAFTLPEPLAAHTCKCLLTKNNECKQNRPHTALYQSQHTTIC